MYWFRTSVVTVGCLDSIFVNCKSARTAYILHSLNLNCIFLPSKFFLFLFCLCKGADLLQRLLRQAIVLNSFYVVVPSKLFYFNIINDCALQFHAFSSLFLTVCETRTTYLILCISAHSILLLFFPTISIFHSHI